MTNKGGFKIDIQKEENQRVLNLLAEHYHKGREEALSDVRKLIGKISMRKGIVYDKPWDILERLIQQINKLEKEK